MAIKKFVASEGPAKPLAYTKAQACVALGKSLSFLNEKLAEGEIKGYRVGSRNVLIPVAEIEKFLASLQRIKFKAPAPRKKSAGAVR